MPSARRRPAINFEKVQHSHQVVRAVQDRIAYAIELDQIEASPPNPRQKIDGVDELAASLQEYGLLQPWSSAAWMAPMNSLPATADWPLPSGSAGHRSPPSCVTKPRTGPTC